MRGRNSLLTSLKSLSRSTRISKSRTSYKFCKTTICLISSSLKRCKIISTITPHVKATLLVLLRINTSNREYRKERSLRVKREKIGSIPSLNQWEVKRPLDPLWIKAIPYSASSWNTWIDWKRNSEKEKLWQCSKMWKAHGLDQTRSRCKIWIKYQSTRWRRKTRSSCCRTFSATSGCRFSSVKY